MTTLATTFARARDTANTLGQFREDGPGFVTERQAQSVADHMLAPTLDRMEADLAVLRARIDAAINTNTQQKEQ